MKVILLAGGKGTRLAEETSTRPKPMVEIGGRPILWHLMGLYAAHEFKDFIVACGYKGEMIKEYFRSLPMRTSDYVIDFADDSVEIIKSPDIDWRVAAVDTGIETTTAGRILRLRHLVGDERFMVTYGDGLGDIDLTALMTFHEQHGRLATVTAVRPPARFGALGLDGTAVVEFAEKPQTQAGWINGGFFVFEHDVLEYLAGDETILEREPLEDLARDGQLMAFTHSGFWEPMDTERDRTNLVRLWATGEAPWRVWDG